MSDHTPSLSPRPLSPRHERFVAAYLKDGNATQAYIRAGYSRRGAQPSASRLLRDPRIEAAIATGRQRITEALAVSVERVTQEYAKIAFACVDDFVSTDDDGRLRIDLEKAHQAQRAGIVELKLSNHSKQEQSVTLKLGKMQALAALTKQLGGLAAKPKPAATPDTLAEDLRTARLRHLAEERAQRAEQALAEARTALAAAEAGRKMSSLENPNPSIYPLSRAPADPGKPPDAAQSAVKAAASAAPQPPDQPPPEPQPRPTVEPGMPTEPTPDFTPGLYPNARIIQSSRCRPAEPDDDDSPYMMDCDYDPYAALRDDP